MSHAGICHRDGHRYRDDDWRYGVGNDHKAVRYCFRCREASQVGRYDVAPLGPDDRPGTVRVESVTLIREVWPEEGLSRELDGQEWRPKDVRGNAR